MLISIVVVYILCWSPLLCFNVAQAFGAIPATLMGVYKHLKTIFSLLAYFNRSDMHECIPFWAKNPCNVD